VIKNEFLGWKKSEIIWLLIAVSVILGLSIYWGDTTLAIISATTGVMCVVLTGKGKISSFIFGLINIVTYIYIAYVARFYGEVMLNAIYYLPMQFVGIYFWNKNMNNDTYEVVKNKLKFKTWILIIIGIVMVSIVYGFILNLLGGNLPYIDSFSTVLAVVAMIMIVKRLTEQWYLWICVNIIMIGMWIWNFYHNQDNLATLLMWGVYLINAIIMLFKWKRESEICLQKEKIV